MDNQKPYYQRKAEMKAYILSVIPLDLNGSLTDIKMIASALYSILEDLNPILTRDDPPPTIIEYVNLHGDKKQIAIPYKEHW